MSHPEIDPSFWSTHWTWEISWENGRFSVIFHSALRCMTARKTSRNMAGTATLTLALNSRKVCLHRIEDDVRERETRGLCNRCVNPCCAMRFHPVFLFDVALFCLAMCRRLVAAHVTHDHLVL